jgi:hypothetical protein
VALGLNTGRGWLGALLLAVAVAGAGCGSARPAAAPTAAPTALAVTGGSAQVGPSADLTAPALTASSSAIGPGSRPGVSWPSGIYPEPVSTAAEIEAFGQWRGRPATVATIYSDRTDGWAEMVGNSAYEWRAFAGWSGTLVISQPFWPEDVGGSLAACAAGDYSSYWATFGRSMTRAGRAASIVRLAWEANGNWFQWSATDPALFRTCFRQVASAIRTADPAVRIDFTINSHYSQNPASHDPRDLYPGDDVVDIIGIDSYDEFPPSPTSADFARQCNAVGGMCWWYGFAAQHGKKFSVAEWGPVSGRGGAGGMDNPVYISGMYSFFASIAPSLGYETLYSNCAGIKSDIWRCGINPHASARYRELWGPA